jgi:hypothetical protein
MWFDQIAQELVFTDGVNELTWFITLYTKHLKAKFSKGSIEKTLNIRSRGHISKFNCQISLEIKKI